MKDKEITEKEFVGQLWELVEIFRDDSPDKRRQIIVEMKELLPKLRSEGAIHIWTNLIAAFESQIETVW